MHPSQIISGPSAIGMAERGGKLYPVAGVPHLRVIRAVGVPSGGVNFTENEILGDGEALLLKSILSSDPATFTLYLAGVELSSFTGRFFEYSTGVLLPPAQALEIRHNSSTIAFVQMVFEFVLIHGPVTLI